MTLNMKKRLDQYLVEQGLCPSRTKAKELIQKGHVLVGEDKKKISTPSYKVDEGVQIELSDVELLKYVSRAGLKLEGAIEKTGIQINGLRCFDVGLSTGGFSHCLLEHGAKEIVGIDVGTLITSVATLAYFFKEIRS